MVGFAFVCLFVVFFPEVLDMKSMSLAHAGQTLLSFIPSASILLKIELVFSLSPRVTKYALDCPLDWSNPHPRKGMLHPVLWLPIAAPPLQPGHTVWPEACRSLSLGILLISDGNFLSPHLQREDWQVTVTSQLRQRPQHSLPPFILTTSPVR